MTDLHDRPDETACCALPEGHDGCCAWICNDCNGTGKCFHCGGTGGYDDANPCTECDGSSSCIAGCFEGMVTDD